MPFLHEGTGFAEPKILCVLQNIGYKTDLPNISEKSL